MGWVVQGHIFDPADHDFAYSHAQVPTALILEDRIRVYYADRFADGRSFTTFLDLDRADPSKVLSFHKVPILPFGAPGTFDDDGVMPSFAVHRDGAVWLYYSGWNRGVSVPYRNSVGIAVSEDGGTHFRRLFEGPVLDRTPQEPYIAVTPSLIREGDIWRMWYISGLRWVLVEDRYEPVYGIKGAPSKDGISWTRPGRLLIPQTHDEEAFSHPSVIYDDDGYHMWFCARSSRDYRGGAGGYRIGYASSRDGENWTRQDEMGGLGLQPTGFASSMTCYPFVTVVDGRRIMFFNGNGFGQSGIGWAIWGKTP